MACLSILKAHLKSVTRPRIRLTTTADVARPLKIVLGSDVSSLNGCRVRNIWGELIDSAPDPDELPEDSKLLLFFEDCLDMNPKPFLF